MKQYLKQVGTTDDYTLYTHSKEATNTHVVYVNQTDELIYGHPENVDEYYYKPFTISLTYTTDDPNQLYSPYTYFFNSLTLDGEPFYVKLSIDGGKSWYTSTENQKQWDDLAIQVGDEVQIISNGIIIEFNIWKKGSWGDHAQDGQLTFSGNIWSLSGGENMDIPVEFPEDVMKQLDTDERGLLCFNGGDNTSIYDCSNLWCPAHPNTRCYSPKMFRYANNLHVAPHMIFRCVEPVDGAWNFGTWKSEFLRGDLTFNLDMSNIKVDVPSNMIIYGDKLAQFSSPGISAMPQLPKHITVCGNMKTYEMFRGLDYIGTQLPSTIYVHALSNDKTNFEMGAQWVLAGNDWNIAQHDFSWIHLYNLGSSDNLYTNNYDLVKTAKMYTHDDTDLGPSTNITTIYLYGYRIPNITTSSDMSNITIHYAKWANNVSEAQEWFPNATFVEDTTEPQFLHVLQRNELVNSYEGTDYDGNQMWYDSYNTKFDYHYLQSAIFNHDDEFRNNNSKICSELETYATWIIYKNIAYQLTHDNDSDFHFTIEDKTYKIKLSYDGSNLLVDLPNDLQGSEFRLVLSCNADTDILNIKYLNF